MGSCEETGAQAAWAPESLQPEHPGGWHVKRYAPEGLRGVSVQ